MIMVVVGNQHGNNHCIANFFYQGCGCLLKSITKGKLTNVWTELGLPERVPESLLWGLKFQKILGSIPPDPLVEFHAWPQ